eukprot:3107061-Amphidinium_carterae.2
MVEGSSLLKALTEVTRKSIRPRLWLSAMERELSKGSGRSVVPVRLSHSAFQVGDLCVRCGEAVENLKHTTVLTGSPQGKAQGEPGMP